MSGPHRLPTGGRIDRSRLLRFRFDGRDLPGHPGDTLASALLANGVRLVARSFKYHRPRGVFTAGPEEPSALVELRCGARREPNVPATTIELFEGLEAASQNRWPSLAFDLGAINGLMAPLLPAGFYYKTFMAPGRFWERVYEPLIRRAAGLGRAAAEADPDRYETMHAHCDLLVVGSGEAGLMAAQAAAEAGRRVMLLEQDFEMGGATLLDPERAAWRRGVLSALKARSEVTLLARTTAFGLYDHAVAGAVERVSDHVAEPLPGQVRQRQWVIRAGRIVLATGSVERLIAFPGNDRPGVMLAGAAQTYLQRFGVAAGRRAVFFVNNDAAYAAAFALAGRGVDVAAVVDVRGDSEAGARAERGGLPVRFGCEIVATHGGRLSPALAGVSIRRIGGARAERVAADLLCISGGHNPQVQLAGQARLPLVWDEGLAAFVAEGNDTVQVLRNPSPGWERGRGEGLAGSGEGASPRRAGVADGAGRTAEPPAESASPSPLPLSLTGEGITPLLPFWEVAAPGKAFVDLQHDVTAADIRLAHREGYGHVEHAKRYTTLGMATDQGKTGGLVGSAILAAARGEAVAAVGVPAARPFVSPVAWGALAGAEVGDHFRPKRRLPLHFWHERHGAVFVRIGLWLRPLVYSAAGDTGWGPVLAEARAVRRAVGVTDVSSLGKIDVQGKDAAAFLDRIYANSFSTLAVGKARYGLMLREDGMVFDDGTTSRLGPAHFVVTTTTANAQAVLEHMEFHHHTAWPDLDVKLTDVADQWAQFAVAGPKARSVLARLVDRDLADAAFPFMAAAEARIAGVPGRLFRISFSGELAYEVGVPAGEAVAVWEAILSAGEPFGITPYGLDALNLLRIEKGHVAGSELGGQTTARDLGLERMLKASGDFIGRTLSQRPGLLDPARPALVGVRVLAGGKRLRAGAHLVAAAGATDSLGFVTAACLQTEGEGFVGLALLADGRARIGDRLHAADPVRGEACDVEVVSPHFVDPANARVRDASPAEPAALPPVPAEPPSGEVTAPTGVAPARGDAATRALRAAQTSVTAGIRLSRHVFDIAEIAPLRGSKAILRLACAANFGLDLPPPGRSTRAGPLHALPIGPDTWLMLDSFGKQGGLTASLIEAVGDAAAIVDQSHAFQAICLSGEAVRWVLSKTCRIDLHDHVFRQHCVARTIIAQSPIVVYRVEPASFILLAPSSLAQSFIDTLVLSAADIGCIVDGTGDATP